MSNCGGCEEITLPLGEDGIDGKNSFTITTSIFSQPAVGLPISINVSNIGQFSNGWASAGQIVYIVDTSGNGGWYSVVSITGETSITINNLDYPGSTQVGLPINSGASVSPSGPRGAAGTAGSAGTAGTSGSQGLPGLNGTAILRTGLGTSNNTITYTSIAPAQTFAANTLCLKDGDKASLEMTVEVSQNVQGSLEVLFGTYSVTSNNIMYAPKGPFIIAYGITAVLKVDIYRKNSTTAIVSGTYVDSDANALAYFIDSIPANFAAATFINVRGRLEKAGDPADVIQCRVFTISSFKS